VDQNVREAVKWFIRAARQGDKTAQYNLGVYYASVDAAEEGLTTGQSPQTPEEQEQQQPQQGVEEG